MIIKGLKRKIEEYERGNTTFENSSVLGHAYPVRVNRSYQADYLTEYVFGYCQEPITYIMDKEEPNNVIIVCGPWKLTYLYDYLGNDYWKRTEREGWQNEKEMIELKGSLREVVDSLDELIELRGNKDED